MKVSGVGGKNIGGCGDKEKMRKKKKETREKKNKEEEWEGEEQGKEDGFLMKRGWREGDF